MNRDRMTSFLAKRSPRAEQLALIHDQGLAQNAVVFAWEAAELDAMRDTGQDLTDVVWDAAQGYANDTGEVCRFKIVWQTLGGQIQNSCVHSATPEDAKRSKAAAGDVVATLTQNNRELMLALGAKDRVLQGSIGIVLKSATDLLELQERVIATQQRTIEVLAQHQGPGAQPEDPQVTALKIKGLERAITLLPDVARVGLAIFADHRATKAVEAAAAAAKAAAEGNGHDASNVVQLHPDKPPDGTPVQ